jgi:hypothetical protein
LIAWNTAWAIACSAAEPPARLTAGGDVGVARRAGVGVGVGLAVGVAVGLGLGLGVSSGPGARSAVGVAVGRGDASAARDADSPRIVATRFARLGPPMATTAIAESASTTRLLQILVTDDPPSSRPGRRATPGGWHPDQRLEG